MPAAAVGVSPSDDAVPFVMGGALHLFTQGHAGAAPMTMPGQDPPDTVYVVRDGKILLVQVVHRLVRGSRPR